MVKAKASNLLQQLAGNKNNDVDDHYHNSHSIDKFSISGGDNCTSAAASPLALKSTPRSGRGGWERTPLGSLLTLGHLSIGLGQDKVAIAPEMMDYQEKEKEVGVGSKGLTLSQDTDWGEDIDGAQLVAQHSPLRNKPLPMSSSSPRPCVSLQPIDLNYSGSSSSSSSSLLRRKPAATASTTGNGISSNNANGNITDNGDDCGITNETTKDDGCYGTGSGSRNGLHSYNTSTSTSRKGSVELPITDNISSPTAVESTSLSEPTTTSNSMMTMCRLNDAVFNRPRTLMSGLVVGVNDDDDDDDENDSTNSPLRRRNSLLLQCADHVIPVVPVPNPLHEAVARPQRNNCPISIYYPPSWGGTAETTEALNNGVSESVDPWGDTTTTTTTITNIPLPSAMGKALLPAQSIQHEPSSRSNACDITDTTPMPATPINNDGPTYTNVAVSLRKKPVAVTSHHHRIITPTPIIISVLPGPLEGVLIPPMTDANAASGEPVRSQGDSTPPINPTLALQPFYNSPLTFL